MSTTAKFDPWGDWKKERYEEEYYDSGHRHREQRLVIETAGKVTEITDEGGKFLLDGVDVSKDVTDFVACLERDAWQIFLRLGRYEQEEGHGEVLVLDGQGNVLYDYDC